MRDKVKKEIRDKVEHEIKFLVREWDGLLLDIWKHIYKLEELTKANDYEYITETKLVKKNKKEK